MISRKATLALADLYSSVFQGSYGSGSSSGYKLRTNDLNDFLFAENYEEWTLGQIRGLYAYDSRSLKNWIMGLSTGISLLAVTVGWEPASRIELGQRLLKDLTEDILQLSETKSFLAMSKISELRLRKQLELDGLKFENGLLYTTEETGVDIETEKHILITMIKKLGLENTEIISHHLKLSDEHYLNSKWGDCISNSRNFLEEILAQTACVINKTITGQVLSSRISESAKDVREFLVAQDLLEKKEKETIAQVYGLLSNTGSHPYIAQQDQARLMRQLAIAFSVFVLLRLEGFLNTKKML